MQRHQPALLGGLFIGVLSSLPFIGGLNACCCLWVVTGGVLAVYLQQQSKPEPLETGDAVLAGLIAGLVGGLIVCIVSYIKMLVVGPIINDALQQARQQIESNADMPPAARDMALRMMQMMSGGGGAALLALITVPVYAVFSMLGALLGLAFFRKKTPPPATQG
jgi:hypothetical protein